MALFVVTYDIGSDNASQPLRDKLSDMDSCHTQDSVWLVSYSGGANGLFDALEDCIEEQDRLMVVEFSKRPLRQKALKGTSDWLDKHL